ncbi:peroxiredoxin [Phanerochaete sordida]|uniref:thioredoxin-dependent peroxiredoxin n=1 Tax=Phanerochaete sordida TaxID=48140 RepID=A0A9P3GMW2_9APHY|nr:peroxiredoxin [Phanerochaete sordida]
MPRSYALTGKPAPPLSLLDANGQTYNLAPESVGRPVVLFFYPKSGTYGCTKEACEFRDALVERESFKTTKAQVIGISSDPVEKQKEFVDKHKLTYPVLSDSAGEARKAYHIGKGLLGLVDARVTVVIDSKGIVRDSLEATMNYGAHVKFVTKWLEQLDAEEKQASAPPPAEPGLITEPALATEPGSDSEPPIAGQANALKMPVEPENEHGSSDVGSPAGATDLQRDELGRAAQAVQA